jgi:hypothetical protein
MPCWHWDDTRVEGEHWLYAHSRVVAIASPSEGHWQIRYPEPFPVQTATTLEAARKLALHVTLWTWPIGGIESKPEPCEKISEAGLLSRDLADAQYVTEDEERLRTEPLDASGNYTLRPRGELSKEPAKEAAKQESPGLLEAAPNDEACLQ